MNSGNDNASERKGEREAPPPPPRSKNKKRQRNLSKTGTVHHYQATPNSIHEARWLVFLLLDVHTGVVTVVFKRIRLVWVVGFNWHFVGSYNRHHKHCNAIACAAVGEIVPLLPFFLPDVVIAGSATTITELMIYVFLLCVNTRQKRFKNLNCRE